MERISEVISNIYQKYLPIAKKFGITLDLDFPDVTLTVHEKAKLESSIDKNMRLAVDRSAFNASGSTPGSNCPEPCPKHSCKSV